MLSYICSVSCLELCIALGSSFETFEIFMSRMQFCIQMQRNSRRFISTALARFILLRTKCLEPNNENVIPAYSLLYQAVSRKEEDFIIDPIWFHISACSMQVVCYSSSCIATCLILTTPLVESTSNMFCTPPPPPPQHTNWLWACIVRRRMRFIELYSRSTAIL